MKKRSLFMVAVLLMLGVNAEAKSLTATTPVAPSEIKNSSQHSYGIPPQVILKVPVDVYVPMGMSITYFERTAEGEGKIQVGTTSGKQMLECSLFGGGRKFTQQVELHNGHYTVDIEFKGIPENDLLRVNAYQCFHHVGTRSGTHFYTGKIQNQESILITPVETMRTRGRIE